MWKTDPPIAKEVFRDKEHKYDFVSSLCCNFNFGYFGCMKTAPGISMHSCKNQ